MVKVTHTSERIDEDNFDQVVKMELPTAISKEHALAWAERMGQLIAKTAERKMSLEDYQAAAKRMGCSDAKIDEFTKLIESVRVAKEMEVQVKKVKKSGDH